MYENKVDKAKILTSLLNKGIYRNDRLPRRSGKTRTLIDLADTIDGDHIFIAHRWDALKLYIFSEFAKHGYNVSMLHPKSTKGDKTIRFFTPQTILQYETLRGLKPACIFIDESEAFDFRGYESYRFWDMIITHARLSQAKVVSLSS